MDSTAFTLKLYEIGAIKTGEFVLKSGLKSPLYVDFRVLISYPPLLKEAANLIWGKIKPIVEYDLICGVPYTALPIATCISIDNDIPMVMRRKEAKSYGTKKLIEGIYKFDQKCVVIEDVITSGSSILETVKDLKSEGLQVNDAVVLLDREQTGVENLLNEGINVHSVLKLNQVLETLFKFENISVTTMDSIRNWINSNPISSISKPRSISFAQRADLSTNLIAKSLFNLMDKKQTNLCVAADLTNSGDILALAEEIGPHICVLKLHIDIVDDFSENFTQELKKISKKYEFLIFEDRKFADIGSTVNKQFHRGVYKISEWADLVNAHLIAGPGTIKGLKQNEIKDSRLGGCLLIAEMSSEGSLCNKSYAERACDLAKDHEDFVIGFISQGRIAMDPKLIHFTPGVCLSKENDNLGQTYKTPEEAIQRGSDIIIVGRGITESSNREQTTIDYKLRSFKAYMASLS